MVALPKPANNAGQGVTQLKNLSLVKNKGRHVTPDEINSIIDCATDEIEREDVEKLYYLSPLELGEWQRTNPSVSVNLMFHICQMFLELAEENAELVDANAVICEKHERATNVIATIMHENKELKAEMERLVTENESMKTELANLKAEGTYVAA